MIIGGDCLKRDDFFMLGSDIVYFDNGATTLKPMVLLDAISDYYNNYSANAHRGVIVLVCVLMRCMKEQGILLRIL